MVIRRDVVSLTTASGRAITVDLTYPSPREAEAALIIFSHGANAAPDRYRVLLDAWARCGFKVAAPLHVDSEEHQDRARHDRPSIRATRIEDYSAVASRFGTGVQVIAAGHSYGALIAQLAGGAQLMKGLPVLAGPKPLAVVALSPPPPMPQVMEATGWSSLAVPTLTVTGDQDVMPGFVECWQQRLAGYHAQSPDHAYSLVVENMDHYGNGSFGRLRPGAPAALVEHFNRLALTFMGDCLAGEGPSTESWLAAAEPGLLTMTRRPLSACRADRPAPVGSRCPPIA